MMVPSSPNEISWRGRRALSGTGKTPTDVKSLTVTWFDAQTLSSNFGLARLQFGEAPRSKDARGGAGPGGRESRGAAESARRFYTRSMEILQELQAGARKFGTQPGRVQAGQHRFTEFGCALQEKAHA